MYVGLHGIEASTKPVNLKHPDISPLAIVNEISIHDHAIQKSIIHQKYCACKEGNQEHHIPATCLLV